MPGNGEPALARDRAYAFAKARILDGTFPSGGMLSEGDVAAAIGVSRTPVRDAFLRLEVEGLVNLYPKRGAIVVPVSPREIRAVLEARELIEVFALQKLAVASDGDRAQLAEELRDLLADQDDAIRRDDDAAFARADRAFHERLVSAAGNPILEGYYVALRDRQIRMNVIAFRRDPDRTRRNRADHHRILDALVVGDVAGLAVQIRRHIHAIGDLLGVRPERDGERRDDAPPSPA